MYYNEPKKTLKERMEETDNQILQAIQRLLITGDKSPTVREITKAARIKSTSTTFAYLKRLKTQGIIDWDPQTWRTLRVLKNKTNSAG